MRLFRVLGAVAATAVAAVPVQQQQQQQQQQAFVDPDTTTTTTTTTHRTISDALYHELERYARLVDIAYCIGGAGDGGDGMVPGGPVGGGLTAPFACASRCREFPEMRLVTTWHGEEGEEGGGGIDLGGRLGRLLLGDGGCGYVAVDTRAHEVVVAFRGTYSLADTVVDLSTVPQAYEPYHDGGDEEDEDDGRCANCTVHSGFLAAWRRTRGVVLPAVAGAAHLRYGEKNEDEDASRSTTANNSTAPPPPLPIRIVGHSLGGAVATLAALEMRALGWPGVRVVTYGAPRLGNGALATYVEGVFGMDKDEEEVDDRAYYRITHQGDPVPLLPPADWGYRAHAGELYIATGALPPAASDVRVCHGRADAACLGGGDGEEGNGDDGEDEDKGDAHIPLLPPYPWERVFAHRDYFWRLGLCVPGGDPANWGRRGEEEL